MPLQVNQELSSLLSKIRSAYPEGKVYLVGGAVRDLLLGEVVKDFDFVLPQGSVELAKAIRKKLRGVGFTLDDEHQTARVIVNQGGSDELVLDFTSFIGGNLLEDLQQRDFTVNAIAIDLDQPDQIIDHLGGLNDLEERRLKLCNPNSLQSDPLRVLRAVRMIRTYNLGYDLGFLDSLRVATTELNRVSGERIRDELLKCLELPGLDETAALLERSGILFQLHQRIFDSAITPAINLESYLSFLRSLENMLESIENKISFSFSKLLPGIADDLKFVQIVGLDNLISEKIQGGRSRKQLLKLFCLFYWQHRFQADTDKTPGANQSMFVQFTPEEISIKFMDAFLLGQKERKYLECLSGGYLAFYDWLEKEELKRLELYRFFRDFGSYGLDSALLWLALFASDEPGHQKFAEFALKIIQTWFFEYEEVVDPPQLIDGDQLQKILNLKPGPKIGILLEAIREAQVLKRVNDLNQAVEFARLNLKEMEET